jgi:hypothetical protein
MSEFLFNMPEASEQANPEKSRRIAYEVAYR